MQVSTDETKTSSGSGWSTVAVDRAKFHGRNHRLAAPPRLPGTCIIEPTIVYQIVGLSPLPPRTYPYKLRKVLAFALIEGPARTARKVREVCSVGRSESEEGGVVVAGRLQGTSRWCAACGRQYSARQSELLFRREMVFPASDEADAIALAQEMVHVLRRDERLFRQVLEFNQYSQEQPPVLPLERPHVEDAWCVTASAAEPAVTATIAEGQHGQSRPLIQIGGGSYPCMYTLPSMRGHVFDTLVEYNPVRAEQVGRRFRFRYVETDYKKTLDRVACMEHPTVVIASYHSQHADIAIDFLQTNPGARVLIEKPPVIGYEQFERLLPYVRSNQYFIEIGYNRRYIRMIHRVTELLRHRQGPVFVTCIVREDDMTDAHWNFWRAEGTRIHANLCHWIDLGGLLTGCRPVEIVCMAGKDFQFSSEVSIRFEDDSVVNLISGVIGNGLRGVQEYIDIRADYLTIKIDDYLKMTVLDGARRTVSRSWPRDKGHDDMYRVFSTTCATGGAPRYGLQDFVRSCVLTEEICHMLETKERHHMIDLHQLQAWEKCEG